MTEKRFTYCKKAHYYGNILDNGEMLGYGAVVDVLNEQHETIERLKRNFKALDEVKCEIAEENEQLKEVLGSILIEVRRDISATNHSGEVKAFVTPNSFDLISEVLRKYGALKDWYE